VSAPENKSEGFPITTCPSSPAARESISVAIPIDLLRKRRVMFRDVDVSQGKRKKDKMVRGRVTLRSSFEIAV
jgi:hypothetical protein